MNTDVLSVANSYADAGISVLAVKTDGTKGPDGDKWKQWQDRIPNAAERRRMFRGKVGIGILGGRVSGNKETLDVDAPELVEPFEAALEDLAPGLLARLPVVATPRNNYGGRHYHYRIDGIVAGNTKLAMTELQPAFNDDGTPEIDTKSGKQKLKPITLIETRGEGGYVVAPGSPAECHDTGLPYKHISGPPITETPVIEAEEHRILWHVARSFNRYVRDDEIQNGPKAKGPGLAPGDDYNARTSWEDILPSAGWAKDRTSGGLTFWRRPGKSRGVSATTGVSSAAGTELLCCFSSNAYPFEGPANGRTCSSYSKFAAYAVLNHGGDYSAAAKALAALGYGDAPKAKSNGKPAQPTARKMSLPERFVPFPVDCLPEACMEFIKQTARSIDCDDSMVALPTLATTAGAIGNSCRIMLKPDYSEPCVLWLVVVAESGTRKSSALDAPVKPIRRRDGEEIRKHNDALASYASDLQRFKVSEKEWQAKGAKAGEPPPDAPEKPVERRYTVSDVTTEGLALKLQDNPRGLLNIREEAAGFFLGQNQYKAGGKGSDETHYLAMHGARSVLMDRKSPALPRIFVPRAALSIVGTIQPGVLRRVFTRERLESGLAARFLMAYPPPRAVRWREQWVSDAVQDRYAALIDRLLSMPLVTDPITNEPQPAMLTLTKPAKRLWVKFHDEHAAEQAELTGELSAAWAKLMGYAARLALVCELCEWASGNDWQPSGEISESSMAAGITLAKWFSAEARRVYDALSESDEQREARNLIDLIDRKGGQITVRQLMRSCRRYRDSAESAEADLESLAAAGAGTWAIDTAGAGRPARVFSLTRGDTTTTNIEETDLPLPSPPSSDDVNGLLDVAAEGDESEVVEWTE